jgi:ABC-2 type transport system ATP-binding protein
LLRQLSGRGRTILISSHVLAEVEQIVDEVVIIHRGRFVTQSSTAELAAQVSAGVRVRSPEAERLRQALDAEGMNVTLLEDGALAVSEGTAERVGELAAANGIVLHELTPQKATLEEAFLELTGGETTT